ncbi:MAG: ABC transporter substrate-binding protein [Planctomycetes bacterium]|nr:ABC transporter substrate-binding protein [Planctomycetota bacterium]
MKILTIALLFIFFAGRATAQLNNPYPASESKEKIYYSDFDERPKHLDPAVAYSSDEYRFLCQIYEPVVQYHYLKRPYQLVPLTAVKLPECEYFDKEGNLLPPGAPGEKVHRSVWTITIQKGILFQEHPCFARDEEGEFLYLNLGEKDCEDIHSLFDFEKTGTRELRAKDYVYEIKRLADPRLQCPIFASVVAKYIVGMRSYSRDLTGRLEEIREKRKREKGILYNREKNEKRNPIVLDYKSIPCEGLEVVDDYTFKITLNQKYPQFRYWLAMPFFAPMPEEAIRFYSQEQTIDRNIVLDWFPIGTGAFRMAKYQPNWRVVLARNENFRGERYPLEGDEGDRAAGLLADAGRELPLIDKAVYSMEREFMPRWQKFLQGYYDISGISSDNFTRVMDLSGVEERLSKKMKKRGIRLSTSVDTTIFYLGFNMADEVLGGLEEERCKLRQAISIAINREEYIQIFLNGRGIVAQSPIPPGIFGHQSSKQGVNSFTHRWDEESEMIKRRSLKDARKLLEQAGYPNGMGPEGKRLAIEYTTVQRPGNAARLNWLKDQFEKLNIRLVINETDYNRFRTKISTGNFQTFMWGWNADYPDPENFLFLLYGPNGKMKYNGENAANYSNPEYDRLFERMKAMRNSPERLKIIKRMIEIVRHDAPWEFGFYTKSYALYHKWVSNVKPNKMANNSLKYRDIEHKARNEYRKQYNQPRWGVVALALAIIIGVLVPGVIKSVRGELN